MRRLPKVLSRKKREVKGAVLISPVAFDDPVDATTPRSSAEWMEAEDTVDEELWRIVGSPHASRPGSPTEVSESSRSTSPSILGLSSSVAEGKQGLDEMERVAAQVDEVVGASSNVPPRAMWDRVHAPPMLRGANYLDDGKKYVAAGAPLTHLFAVQAFALDSTREHVAGASARLLQLGAVVPPADAKLVVSLHWMLAPARSEAPRDSRDGASHCLMMHSYSTGTAEEAAGAPGALLRELWSGDATAAISRAKFLCDLKNGPKVVSVMMTWLGLNATRPLLIGRQIHMSVNRATVEVDGRPIDHVEIALDIAASPACKRVWRHIFGSLASVDVAGTLVLEGRTPSELPEHPLTSFQLQSLDPTVLAPQPAAYPASPSEVPGVLFGSSASDREAESPGSWQATRAKVTAMKQAAKDAGGLGSSAGLLGTLKIW